MTGESPSASTSMRDYTGITTISGQMQAQLRQLDPEYKGGSGFYIGSSNRGTKTFVWNGVKWSTAIVLSRIFWLGVAVFLTLIAAGLFDRFDPAREIVVVEAQKKTGCSSQTRGTGAAASPDKRNATPRFRPHPARA